MAKKEPTSISIKCRVCSTVVISRSIYDWQRCECGLIWLMGGAQHAQIGLDPKQAGSLRDVLTTDGEPFFRTCAALFCEVTLWPRWQSNKCIDHYDQNSNFAKE